MASDSHNFPTAMHDPSQNSLGGTAGGSTENFYGAHEGGPAFFGSLYPEQNLVDRDYNPDPRLQQNWNLIPEPQYHSNSSLLYSNVHNSIQGSSSLVETRCLLSESQIQDNPFAHGPQGHDGEMSSYFCSPQTQNEAMQLCLNPSNYNPEKSTQAASVYLVQMPPEVAFPTQNILDNRHSQQHFFNIYLPPPAVTQNVLADMDLNLGNQEMSSAPLPVYNNWRNGGNELLFVPGSDLTMHTQPVSNQLSSHIQQQAEIPQYGSRRTLSQQGQTVHDGNYFSHNDDPGQGLSLSLSSQQPSSGLQLFGNHGRHEYESFATTSQDSSDLKGKALVECAEGTGSYNNNGISLSGFRPQREVSLTITGNQGLENSYHQTLHPEDDTTKQQYLVFTSISNDHFMPVHGQGPFYDNEMLRCCQLLLNEICNIRVMEKRKIVQIDQGNTMNWRTNETTLGTSNNLFSSHAGREVMGADNPTGWKENLASNMIEPIPCSTPLESARVWERPVQFEIRPANRVELEHTKLKLTSSIEELDWRYAAFCDRMNELRAKFNALAGEESGTPYIAVAVQTMSQSLTGLKYYLLQLRRDVKKALDQQVRDQQAREQTNVIQEQSWRPHRGLPEPALRIMRDWLFAHFLNPYPTLPEKKSLADQAGLRPSQVSYWFINARVRLWKPMVEEMYNEEFKNDAASSAERNPSARKPRRTEKNKAAMVSNDASVPISSEQAERDAAVERQRILIASMGEELYARSKFGASSSNHGMTNQNTANQLDFDPADRRDGNWKKSRLNEVNHQIYGNWQSSEPLVHMEMDAGGSSHFQHWDPRRIGSSNYGSSSEQGNINYNQHQDILTTSSNGGRHAAYAGAGGGGGSLNQGNRPGSSFLYNRNPSPINGDVSFLTLGLYDGLGAAPQAQSNEGNQSSGWKK